MLAVVIHIFKSKRTPLEVTQLNDLIVGEVERWIEEGEWNIENSFRTRPKDVRELCEKELQETREALRGAHFQR